MNVQHDERPSARRMAYRVRARLSAVWRQLLDSYVVLKQRLPQERAPYFQENLANFGVILKGKSIEKIDRVYGNYDDCFIVNNFDKEMELLERYLAGCRSKFVESRGSKFVESRGRVGVEALAGRNRQIPAEASTPECFSDRLLGARIIEKHFTIAKDYSDFHDHQLSADPQELNQLVQKVRETLAMLGNGEKRVQDCEREVIDKVRRSIVASRDLDEETVLTWDDLAWVRPGGGLAPGREGEVLGKVLTRPIQQGEMILIDDVCKHRGR